MDDLENARLEAAVLGALVANGDLIHKVSDLLRPEVFNEPLHSKLYGCITKLHQETGQVSGYQLLHKFTDVFDGTPEQAKQNYVDIVVKAGSLAGIKIRNLAKTLVELHQKRQLSKLFADLSVKITLGEGDATEIAALALSGAEKIIAEGGRDNSVTINKAFERIYDQIGSPEPAYKAKTGITVVDIGTDKGLELGRVYGFIAPAKCGKTMLATTMSNNLCDAGHKHLFVCAEMGSAEISARMLGQRLDRPIKDFRDKKDDELREQVAEQVARVKQNIIFEDEPGIEFSRLRAVVEKHIHRSKIEGFILDYYQLVSGQEHNKSKADHLESVANWIHYVCKKNNIWCILLIQTNDEGKVLNSRGLDRACDQKYMIKRPLDENGDPKGSKAWLVMQLTRYTRREPLGTELNPSLEIHHNGTHFVNL